MRDVEHVQFARLLDEINAVGLTEQQLAAVAKSMGLKPQEVKEVLNSASHCMDKIKPLLAKKTPLTEDQVSEELAENGRVEALVAVEFSEIVGQLEDNALDTLVDDIAQSVAAVDLSEVDYKPLFVDGDSLYLHVTAKSGDMEEDEDEEDEDEEDDAEV